MDRNEKAALDHYLTTPPDEYDRDYIVKEDDAKESFEEFVTHAPDYMDDFIRDHLDIVKDIYMHGWNACMQMVTDREKE